MHPRTADPDTAKTAIVRRTDGRTLRKSCDRCHQLKLRCVGDKTLLTQCKRCQVSGLECVYGTRSRKKTTECSLDHFVSWNHWPDDSSTTILEDPTERLDTVYGPELTQFDAVFTPSPLSQSVSGDNPAFALPTLPNLGDNDRSFVGQEISIPSLSPGSLREAGERPITEFPRGPPELGMAFQELEATFINTVDDQTSREAQDYPIGQVLNALSSFLEALKYSSIRKTSCPSTSDSLFSTYLRSKQASIAAQGYVMCVKLLVSLLEQMLQSLLTSPSTPTSGTPTHSESTQNTDHLRKGPAAPRPYFSDASHIPNSLRLGDLRVPPDHFSHALTSSVNLLRVGCNRLNEMEHLLGIPSRQLGPSTSSLDCQEVVINLTPRPEYQDRSSSIPSLASCFVASIWDDEASINKKSSRVYLDRCYAAILGIAEHCT